MGLYQSIFDGLKAEVETNEYLPKVVKVVRNQKNLPIVEFARLDGSLFAETLDKQEQMFDITYEVNIYGQNKVIDGVEIPVDTILDSIESDVYNYLVDTVGLDLVNSYPRPNADLTIDRRYMRFNGKYDLITNTIYRGF